MLRFILIVFTAISVSGCGVFAKVWTPTYSHHSDNKLSFEKNNGYNNNVYLKKSEFDVYGLGKNVIDEVKKELNARNITIVDDPNKAKYVVGLHINNISIDIDAQFAQQARNALLAGDLNVSYIFDKNNSPHINATEFKYQSDNNQTSAFGKRRRILPSVLYTMIGSGIGFTAGYMLAGSSAPVAWGLGGAVILGGLTYATYSTFKDIGVFIVYDITVEEKLDKNIQHTRKIATKSAGNIADEAYYTYNNNIVTHISKNAVIAIGSRVLKHYMVEQSQPFITNSILNTFNNL